MNGFEVISGSLLPNCFATATQLKVGSLPWEKDIFSSFFKNLKGHSKDEKLTIEAKNVNI